MVDPATFFLTGNPAADQLLATDPNALLLGMVLDQQIMMEKAFGGPAVIAERMGGLDVRAIAAADPEKFVEICARTPAVHRFPGSMAGRLQAVCQLLVRDYQGDAGNIWANVPTGSELRARIADLPGFGDQKARMFVALLGKRYGVTPPGWREAAGRYGDADTRLSVADVVDDQSLAEVRAAKKAAKAAAKADTEPAGKVVPEKVAAAAAPAGARKKGAAGRSHR